MKIYFAGSIRAGRDDKEIYLEIIELLQNYGEILTEHVGAASLTQMGEQNTKDEFIYQRDMEWLISSDIVVDEVTNPSLGVGYELAKAEENKIPVICLYREQQGKRLSAMINGNNNFKVFIYKNVSEVSSIFDEYLNNRVI